MVGSCAHGHWPMGHSWAPGHYPYFVYAGPYAYPYPISLCPVCCQPQWHCHCAPKMPMVVPEEALVDASSPKKEVFVGGNCDAKLTLEYMPVTLATSSVTVTITVSGSTTTWKEQPISDGYHVKKDFSSVAPGAKVVVEVTDAIARLRWCEVIDC